MMEKTTKGSSIFSKTLDVKTFVLRHLFYGLGKVYLETVGREIEWAKEKIRWEEECRIKSRKIVRCDKCGSHILLREEGSDPDKV